VTDKVDEALRKTYVKVFYQPIVRVETGRICGYEALARWDDPVMGFLPPSRFILTLENFRMTHKVDCHVIHKVCEDLHGLIASGEPAVPVSVNLSRLDFDLCDIFTEVEQYLTEYEVPRSLIDIEITESAMNEDSKGLVSTVQKFRNAGYRVWVDDFGSGYSALNTLMDYDFDVLKLDLEFLRTFDENPRAGELIEHIVSVAKSMGVVTLQEGVERAEHLEFLHRIGCDMVQGYLFAKPMSLAESRAHTRANGLSWE
jgi:EAL domain-containing protein (putative c-di-GMP-specific phosphodiesterase class I)